MTTEEIQIPTFVTHYFHKAPFQSLTDLSNSERAAVIAKLEFPSGASHRFQSAYYFDQRKQYELQMHRQFLEKGGCPIRQRPHYAVLGESEIWDSITTNSIRIPLSEIPPEQISFTYTDSWFTFVEREADGTINPQKPQYNNLYRLEELPSLFSKYGWPGDRWKSEPEWKNDIYVEAQLWSDESVQRFTQVPEAT